ncbi:hypothetical protein VTN00DRAFT_9767 [Thermoascus crustaceus]|uniref:uncharacterized protein n=1 Tax=Thermoascus crustaceus TaxID=5088 RepID=UPI003743B9B3
MYNFWNVVLEKVAGRGLSDKFHVATRRKNRQRGNTEAGPTEPAGAAPKIYNTRAAAPERTFPTAVCSGNVLHANRIRFAVAFGRLGNGQSIFKKPRGELAKPVVTEAKVLETRERVSPFKRWNPKTAKGYPIILSRFGWSCKDADTPRAQQFIAENICSLCPVIRRDIEKLPEFPGWNELCKALEDEYARTHAHYIWQARQSVAAWIASRSKPSVLFAGSVGPRPSWAKTSEEQVPSSSNTSLEEPQQVPPTKPDLQQAYDKKEEDEESESYRDDECAIESCSLSELSFFEREAFVSSRPIKEQGIQAPAAAVQNNDKEDEESRSCTDDECAIESYDPIKLSFFDSGPARRPLPPHQPSTRTRGILTPAHDVKVEVNDNYDNTNDKEGENGEDAPSSSRVKHKGADVADTVVKRKYRLIKVKGMRVFRRMKTIRRSAANVDQQDHSPASIAEEQKQEQGQQAENEEQKDDIHGQATTACVQEAKYLWGKARMDLKTGDVLGYAEAEAPPIPTPIIPSTTLDTLVQLQHRSDGNFAAIPGTNLRESIENYGGPWGKYHARCMQDDGFRRQGVDVDAAHESRETMPKVPIYAGPLLLGRLEHLQEGDFWRLPDRRRVFRRQEAPDEENSYISLRWKVFSSVYSEDYDLF